MSKEFLLFAFLGYSASGKTKSWEVRNRHTDCPLGVVCWKAHWRRYVFVPRGSTLFDAACLGEIAAFITGRMEERRHGR